MFYAYLQCSVASVLPRGMGLSPGFYFIFYFFGSLEREPSLWENTWPWEILRTWESFPGIRLGNQDLWGGEKESTFDTGRRVETGTYHWEGRKPFIQTFEQKDCCWPILAPNWLGFSVSMFPTSISGRRTKRYPNMEMIGWCLVDVFSCFFPYHGNSEGIGERCESITALQRVDMAEWAHPVHVVPVDTPAMQANTLWTQAKQPAIFNMYSLENHWVGFWETKRWKSQT